jgi:hypothetical protein
MVIDTPHGPLSVVLLGSSGGRAMTMLTRQPATIAWIDAFQPNSVFWDVGANIGVFTRCTPRCAATPASWPSSRRAVNYFLLAANCEANKFDSRVAVSARRSRSRAFDRAARGLAVCSGKSFSFLGKEQPYQGRQAALVLSMDQLIEDYGMACPNYIKDRRSRISEDVINGGERMLPDAPSFREIHIELTTSKGGPANRGHARPVRIRRRCPR